MKTYKTIIKNNENLQNICKNGLNKQKTQQNISVDSKSMEEQVNSLNKSVLWPLLSNFHKSFVTSIEERHHLGFRLAPAAISDNNTGVY